MQNSYEKPNVNKQTNPFAKNIEKDETPAPKIIVTGKRLNIIDMDVLNSSGKMSEEEILETKIKNLSNMIKNNSQNLDPVALEELKIEWETLRDKLNKKKNNQKNKTNSQLNFRTFKTIFSKMSTTFKLYSPKFKAIMNTFNEINKEVEDLVKKATPSGEEEIKYGMLVNKLYQASKLNETLTSEIK